MSKLEKKCRRKSSRCCAKTGMRQERQSWGTEQNTLGIMGVTCNYFIALKIPELLVSVYRARARQGHKLQPLGLAPNAQQSRTGPSFLFERHTGREQKDKKVMDGGWPLGHFFSFSTRTGNSPVLFGLHNPVTANSLQFNNCFDLVVKTATSRSNQQKNNAVKVHVTPLNSLLSSWHSKWHSIDSTDSWNGRLRAILIIA